MNKADIAAGAIATGKLNCAQSVLTVYCQELGLDNALARKIPLGFGGGMGRSGKTCGAVTGAYMVLGLKQPERTAENAQTTKDQVYALVRDFNRRFSQIHGSTNCLELLGCDLSTPEGLAKAREKNLFATLCPKFVKSAVEILEQMEVQK